MERDINTGGSLESLKASNFEIVDNEPHILGWTIKDDQGRTIGEVDDLIFDMQTRRVRYIVMDLEGNVLDLEPRDVLVPIGIAELHPSDDDVILPGVTAEHLRPLPAYKTGTITRDIENGVVAAFSTVKGAVKGAAHSVAETARDVKNDVKDDFYSHEHFNENRTFSTRPAPTPPLISEESELSKKVDQTGSTELPRIVEKRNVTDPSTNVTNPNTNVTNPNTNLSGSNTNLNDPNKNVTDPNLNLNDPDKKPSLPNERLND